MNEIVHSDSFLRLATVTTMRFQMNPWLSRLGVICLPGLLWLMTCGCTSSDPPLDERDAPAVKPSVEIKPGGYVPPTVVERVTEQGAPTPATSQVPNKYQIRIYDEREVVTVGATREPFLEEQEVAAGSAADTRTVRLLAYTCTKPACQSQGNEGRPILFTRSPEEFIIGSEGRVMRPAVKDIKESINLVWGPPECPHCGSNRHSRIYVLPEVRKRKKELEAELTASRRALAEARSGGGRLPPGVRPPVEIHEELKSLPQLFLNREIR